MQLLKIMLQLMSLRMALLLMAIGKAMRMCLTNIKPCKVMAMLIVATASHLARMHSFLLGACLAPQVLVQTHAI